ncbi:T9SS type A sorting domain-containing protein [Hymenobacter sp. YC55]|uniref:T9SS type A sorting domain-containing protein n=1 Tax=Hymenobacter sp. YC55 TaxID=3034019 RepID=UPI0023F95880|nr:T9SS type A sorting domain-containing protein [Hymenobacter sp. YC55]MDF7810912.1 T9SS type A sorting domain-containing protein [Hymenobacter sp. YC55]
MHTPPILRQAYFLLAILFLSFNTSAQTAPTWQSARVMGSARQGVTETAMDAAGNLYEVGHFSRPITFDGTTLTSVGDVDGYLAKYTAAGTLAWVRQLGSPGWDMGHGVAVDATGNVYVTGAFTGSIALGNNLSLEGGSNPSRKAYVIRYSPQGTPEWVQQSTSNVAPTTEGYSIGLDANGTVSVTGTLNYTFTIGSTTITLTGTNQANNTGAYLARFSGSTGALLSLQPAFYYFTNTGSIAYSIPKVAVAPTGETYLLNTFYKSIVFGNTTLTTRGEADIVVAKYSAQGTFEWAQQFGGASNDYMGDGKLDAAGNLYLVGDFTGPATFGTTTLPGYGTHDGFLLKCSAQGALQWVQPSGGPGSDGFADVEVDAAGNPYVVGTFNGTAQLGPLSLRSAGSDDILVASYTPQGQVRWVQSAGGPGADMGYTVELDAGGNVYATGAFASSCSFGSLTLTTTAASEKFMARLGSDPLATRTNQAAPASLYPNPATTTVHIPSVSAGSQVQLLNMMGRITCTLQVASDATIPLQGVLPGLYVLRATDAQGRQVTGRLVVE